MSKFISLGVLAAFILGAIAIVVTNRNAPVTNPATTGDTSANLETLNPAGGATGGTTSTKPATGGTTSGGNTGGTTAKGYTMADVAKHATQSSCWTVVNGNVYDVTAWIGQHPGGAQAILSMCGVDGSAGFNGQHGGQRRPANELASFLLGPLATAGTSASTKTTASSGTSVTAPSGSITNSGDDNDD